MSYASLQTLAKTLLWMFYGFLNFIVLLIPNTNCWWTMWNSLNPVLRLTCLSLNLWTQQIIGLFCYFSWKVAHVLILIYWRKVTSFLFLFFKWKKETLLEMKWVQTVEQGVLQKKKEKRAHSHKWSFPVNYLFNLLISNSYLVYCMKVT